MRPSIPAAILLVSAVTGWACSMAAGADSTGGSMRARAGQAAAWCWVRTAQQTGSL